MSQQKSFLYIFLCLLLCTASTWATDHPKENDIACQVVSQYEHLKALNTQNEKEGNTHRNWYVLMADNTEDPTRWIENHNHKAFDEDALNSLNQILQTFNASRKDQLRLYVLVGDYEIVKAEKQDVKLTSNSMLPDEQSSSLTNVFKTAQFSKSTITATPNPGAGSTPHAIAREIQKRLAAYPELILYSYSVVRWTDKEGHGHTESGDGLYINSPKLQGNLVSRIGEKARVEDCGNMNIVKCISATVYKIIEVIGIEYDGAGSNSRGIVNCGEKASDIQKGAQGIIAEGLLQPHAIAAANLLDKPTGNQRVNSQYLIADDPTLFNNPFFRDRVLPDPVFMTEMLPEKLDKLAAPGNSQFKVYVVCFKLPFVLPDAQRKDFARMVSVSSKVAQQPNTIIIVAPYYACEESKFTATKSVLDNTGAPETTTAVSDKKYHESNAGAYTTYELMPLMFMPCASIADNTLNEAMNAALVIEKGFRSGFTQVYTKIPKKWEVWAWDIIISGDAMYMGKGQEPRVQYDVIGHEDITELVIRADERLLEILAVKKQNRFESTSTSLLLSPTGPAWKGYPPEFRARVKTLCEEISRILYKPQKFKVLSACANPSLGCLGIKQSRFTWEVANDFVNEFIARKLEVLPKKKIQDDVFYGKENPFKNTSNIVLQLIDYASIVSSVVGLDFIFDAIGTYYAFSIDDRQAGALYAVSLAIPLVAGGTLRQALAEGSSFVVRLAKGGYAVVSRRMMEGVIGLNLALGLGNEVSELALRVLNPDVFGQVIHLAGKEVPALVGDIEKLALKDADEHLKYLNTTPGVVDDYSAALKEAPIPVKDAGSSPLEEFINSERNQTYLDPVTPLPFEKIPAIQRASLGSDAIAKQTIERLMNVQAEPGWIDIIIHTSDGKFWVNGKFVTHRDLAKYLKKIFPHLKNAKGIRLIACGDKLPKEVAEFLSSKIAKGMPVKKANVKIGASKDGRILGEQEGKWEKYQNENWTEAEAIAIATPPDDVKFLGFTDNKKLLQQELEDKINFTNIAEDIANSFTSAEEALFATFVKKVSTLDEEQAFVLSLYLAEIKQHPEYLFLLKDLKESILASTNLGKYIEEIAISAEYISKVLKNKIIDAVASPTVLHTIAGANGEVKFIVTASTDNTVRVYKPGVSNATSMPSEKDLIVSGILEENGYIGFTIKTEVDGVVVAKGKEAFEEFYKGIEELEQLNNTGRKVKGLTGNWESAPAYRANLDRFNKNISEKVLKGNMTAEEAALDTFTGGYAGSKDFTTVDLTFVKLESDGVLCTHVKFRFSKDAKGSGRNFLDANIKGKLSWDIEKLGNPDFKEALGQALSINNSRALKKFKEGTFPLDLIYGDFFQYKKISFETFEDLQGIASILGIKDNYDDWVKQLYSYAYNKSGFARDLHLQLAYLGTNAPDHLNYLKTLDGHLLKKVLDGVAANKVNLESVLGDLMNIRKQLNIKSFDTGWPNQLWDHAFDVPGFAEKLNKGLKKLAPNDYQRLEKLNSEQFQKIFDFVKTRPLNKKGDFEDLEDVISNLIRIGDLLKIDPLDTQWKSLWDEVFDAYPSFGPILESELKTVSKKNLKYLTTQSPEQIKQVIAAIKRDIIHISVKDILENIRSIIKELKINNADRVKELWKDAFEISDFAAVLDYELGNLSPDDLKYLVAMDPDKLSRGILAYIKIQVKNKTSPNLPFIIKQMRGN